MQNYMCGFPSISSAVRDETLLTFYSSRFYHPLRVLHIEQPLPAMLQVLAVSNTGLVQHSVVRTVRQASGDDEIEAAVEAVSLGHVGWHLSIVVPETGHKKVPLHFT